ncbi:MAG: hypothetical protein AB7N65_19750 [Vicinamibacterales bacterium]
MSPESLIDEAVKRYLAGLRLRRFQRVASYRAQDQNITEDDVPRLVEEYRAERRR